MRRFLFFVLAISFGILNACNFRENTMEGQMDTHKPLCLPESPLIFSKQDEEENLAGKLQEQAAGMMVQIVAEGLLGSGVIYEADEDKLYIATAGHVLHKAEETVWITFVDGLSVLSSEYWRMEQEDLAFIAVPLTSIPKESLKQYYKVNIDKESFDKIKAKDRVIAMGSKTGVAKEAYEGRLVENWVYVESFQQYMMLANVELSEGMSGGGLYDSQGHFLGVLCGKNEDGEVAVLPLSVLQAAFEL